MRHKIDRCLVQNKSASVQYHHFGTSYIFEINAWYAEAKYEQLLHETFFSKANHNRTTE